MCILHIKSTTKPNIFVNGPIAQWKNVGLQSERVVNQIPHVSPCASLKLGARSHQDSSEAAQAVTLGFKGIIEEMMIE